MTQATSVESRLRDVLRGCGSVAVALSGGVDSAVVAFAARAELGGRALAVTGRSASLAAAERDDVEALVARIGIRHRWIDTAEFADPAYAANDGRRCYHCKSHLYDDIARLRGEEEFAAICSGANLDDADDYRPGLAAAAERGVRHPLQEAGLDKAAVRALARGWGLEVWDKPAAPCLASRLAPGVAATAERVGRVEAVEALLRAEGLRDVRVRVHPQEHARIEVAPADLPRLVAAPLRGRVVAKCREVGFRFVGLDLAGFRSGGLNVLVPDAMSGATPGAAAADPVGSSGTEAANPVH